MRKYIYAAMIGLFIGTVAGLSGATEKAPEKSKMSQPGRCWREVSFNETLDGSFVVRSAWRCEQKGK